MSAPAPTSLMTQYADGQLVTRELQDMMGSEREQASFDRDFDDDIERLVDKAWGKYSSDSRFKS